MLDGCFVQAQPIDRADGARDYYLDLLERGHDGNAPRAYVMQMRDRDELSMWLQAITIASKLTQDVPFAGIYRIAGTDGPRRASRGVRHEQANTSSFERRTPAPGNPNGTLDRVAALLLGPWKRRAAIVLHLVTLCFGAGTVPTVLTPVPHCDCPADQLACVFSCVQA